MFLLSEAQHRGVRVRGVLLQQGVPQDTQARQILSSVQGVQSNSKTVELEPDSGPSLLNLIEFNCQALVPSP